MITIKTLENSSIEQILEVFNLSFSDYIVPFCLSKEQLTEKIKSDGIQLEISVGVFDNDKLIAFILHGYNLVGNLKVVYNAGTGVIPAKRGNKLTSKLYEFILPIFLQNNIDKIQLEVITTNSAALKTYKNLGFEIVRELNCYKGSLQETDISEDFEIRNLDEYNWQKLQSFWDFKPSWQNSITAVEKLKNTNVSLGIYVKSDLFGYIIYNPALKRIQQFAIDKNNRNKGFGNALLSHISTHYGKEISVINVKENIDVNLFMSKVGLQKFIKQYEMELVFNKA